MGKVPLPAPLSPKLFTKIKKCEHTLLSKSNTVCSHFLFLFLKVFEGARGNLFSKRSLAKSVYQIFSNGQVLLTRTGSNLSEKLKSVSFSLRFSASSGPQECEPMPLCL